MLTSTPPFPSASNEKKVTSLHISRVKCEAPLEVDYAPEPSKQHKSPLVEKEKGTNSGRSCGTFRIPQNNTFLKVFKFRRKISFKEGISEVN